ncbi:photosystem II stability/assembly factor-like uncharacterized protein [Paraburkholderia sp. BL27I4N3]|uniref:WD40/YVTN/BNR-like repeat-containing protein n=1 Tax=Paraburkholderia sp. BL27I4N3 TaxID=1938805 RepID=UPI000E370994|nr:YCF48-related protein [Paraburkholderia sp. BL27I4N3]REE18124.1 photosystem II stability/assembly factor-like uncharacterized protein [Paraburkholderia sp. BL27I4N3]
MKSNIVRNIGAGVLAGCCLMSLARGVEQVGEAKPQLQIRPAERSSAATGVQLLGVAKAGRRLVAVGDHGVVMLSDDDGHSFRQAATVPVDSTLTAVSFSDAHNGWAVGHWGVVIRTVDGGDTWALQRSDTGTDQPLFSVFFKNANEGWAVGLWSLMLHTTDAGATWTAVKLPPPPGSQKADRNLYKIFADSDGALYVACEQGRVIRSTDSGAHWTYAETGYSGSFWTGAALDDGTLLVGGLRGSIFRSSDHGVTWQASKTPFKSSVTDIVQTQDHNVLATSLDGVMLTSIDEGKTFAGKQGANRTALTAVIDPQKGVPVILSDQGVAKP